MRKLVVLLIVFAVLSAGCIGSPQKTGGSVVGNESRTTSIIQTSPVESGEKPINPKGLIDAIKQYTYTEKATVELGIEMKAGNLTQRTNVSLLIEERGYVDIKNRRARIETRTTTLPGNVTVNTTWIVIGQRVYVESFGNVTVENDTKFWEVHPVALARKLLELEPIGNYTENGTLVLVYSVPGELVLPLAELYFTTPEMNTTITDATAELRFTRNSLKGIKLIYSVRASTTTNGLGGEIEVVEVGTWRGTIRITSVNEKEEVAPPT